MTSIIDKIINYFTTDSESANSMQYSERKAALKKKAEGDYKNPYQYDLESFKKVDPELIKYSQTSAFPVYEKQPQVFCLSHDGAIWAAGQDTVAKYQLNGRVLEKFTLSSPVTALYAQKAPRLWLGLGNQINYRDLTDNITKPFKIFNEKAIITSIIYHKQHIYAADAGNKIIHILAQDANTTGHIPAKGDTKGTTGFLIPSPFFDIAMTPDNTLWAANTGRRSLENFTLEGATLSSWGASGMQIEAFAGCCNPCRFALLPNGGFVTAEKGMVRVKIYNEKGKLESVVAPPDDFNTGTPWVDVAADAAGAIYILDPERSQIRVYNRKAAMG